MQQTLIYVVWAGDQIEWSFPRSMSVWVRTRVVTAALASLASAQTEISRQFIFNLWPDGARARQHSLQAWMIWKLRLNKSAGMLQNTGVSLQHFMQQTLFRLRQAWNPLSLVFSLVDPVINPSLPSGLFEMRLLLKWRNARKCHELQLSCLGLVCAKCVEMSRGLSRPAEGKIVRNEERRLWASDNAPLSQNIVAVCRVCRGWCAAVCSVCSQSWSPAPAWCHDAMMPWWWCQSRQMPVSTSGRHSHDVMQTEHYPGMNYCHENNQVRRIIRIIKHPRHIIHQMYILLIRQLSWMWPCSRWTLPWWSTPLVSDNVVSISDICVESVRQTAPAKSAQSRPGLSRSKKLVSCKSESPSVWASLASQQGRLFCTMWWE